MPDREVLHGVTGARTPLVEERTGGEGQESRPKTEKRQRDGSEDRDSSLGFGGMRMGESTASVERWNVWTCRKMRKGLRGGWFQSTCPLHTYT